MRVSSLPAKRKSLPPIFIFGVVMFLTCSAARPILFYFQQGAEMYALVASGLILVILLIVIRQKGMSLIFLLGISMCAGASIASVSVFQQYADEEYLLNNSGECIVTVTQDASQSTYSIECTAQAILANGRSYNIELMLPQDKELPKMGDSFQAQASFKGFKEDYLTNKRIKGLRAKVSLTEYSPLETSGLSSELYRARNHTIDFFESHNLGEQGSLLPAFLCGYRASLYDSDVYEAFTIDGLAHLVAVSGTHLVLISGMIQILLSTLGVSKRISVCLQIFLLLLYLFFSGFSVSALRSTVMISIALSSFFVGRRPSSLNALGIVIVSFVLTNPALTASLSFILSVVSTAGILVFMPLTSAWIEKIAPFVPQSIKELLSLTLSSSLIATPLTCAYFSQLSLISPLSNVVIGPLFPVVFVFTTLSACCSFVFVPLAEILLFVANALLSIMTFLVSFLANIPFACIPVNLSIPLSYAVSATLFILLWKFWPLEFKIDRLKLVGLSTVLIAIILVANLSYKDEIIMLNVGQGDAFIIRSKGKAVLIDTGKNEDLLKQALARQRIYHLDAVLLTHSDEDHVGEIESLVQVVETDTVLCSNDTLSCSCDNCRDLCKSLEKSFDANHIKGCSPGDTVCVGNFTLEIIWPSDFSNEGGNEDSLCLIVQHATSSGETDGFRAFFGGDAEAETLKEISKSTNLRNIDMLKVPHHGSKKGLDDELLDEMNPQLALISVGQNSYGHPHADTLSLLETHQVRIARSDISGDVICQISPQSVQVSSSVLQ